MSDSLRLHGLQLTRLLCPWDFPDNSTGVDCHFLLQSIFPKWSEVAQSYLTLCDPMDCSLPGSPVHGILQARILEWVAISFSRGHRCVMWSTASGGECSVRKLRTWVTLHTVEWGSHRVWRKRGGLEQKIGEGNGNPLQYSCLENPMDGGAW